MRPASWPIAARIAVAGITGTFAAVLVFITRAPDFLACRVMQGDCHRWAVAPPLGFGELTLGSLALTVLVLVLTGPLIAIAVAAGLIFRHSIAQHTFAWSLASPVAVWLFICLVEASRPYNPYLEARSFPQRLWIHVLSAENLLYLFGASTAGLVFYVLSVMGRDAPVSNPGVRPPG